MNDSLDNHITLKFDLGPFQYEGTFLHGLYDSLTTIYRMKILIPGKTVLISKWGPDLCCIQGSSVLVGAMEVIMYI